MRRLLLPVLLILPVALSAQFPGPGSYKMIANPAGSEQEIPLDFKVTTVGDSTTFALAQGEQQIPLTSQGVISGGFFFRFGNVYCPFVVIDDRYEAVCSDPGNEPLYVFKFPRKPEPPATP